MSSSCFKIIACGGRDFVDDNLLESSSQSKGASEKRGWSFRKRSTRHRVLSNTVVISEAPAAGSKESHESAVVDFQRQPSSNFPDKTSAYQTEEKSQFPLPIKSKLSEDRAAEPADAKADINPNEAVVITIQAAIRGFLAQRVLLKHKNVTKLQSAIRGHLVRRHAVGTLRCIQAIVKMQTLVRARRARILEEGSSAADGKDDISMPMGKVKPGSKSPVTYTSIEKLLSNRFARQLLESTPRTKSINIKCDPLKSDSAWKWLERWMSVSSTENEALSDKKQQEEKKIEHVASQEKTAIVSDSNCKSVDLHASIEASESKENLFTYDAERFDVPACRPSSPSMGHNLDQSVPQNISEINSEKMIPDSFTIQKKESDFPREVESMILGEADAKDVQSGKRVALEQLEPEGKKFSFGSRKTSNPAFLSTHSKFEELSSCANSTKSFSSTNQDKEVESHTDTLSSFTDHTFRKKESGFGENLVSNNSKLQFVGSDASRVQFCGSECGTELSISSTLDSPNRSDGGANQYEHEGRSMEDKNRHPDSKENVKVEAKGEPTILDSDLHDSDVVQPERQQRINGVNDNGANSVLSVEMSHVGQTPDKDVSRLQMETETEQGQQIWKSTTEASPRSHATVSEPHGTPSSEVSVKLKRVRGGKSGSNHKSRSLSDGKKSPSNVNHGSGALSSIEQLHKDPKTGKRRNSFGSPRPDHVDQEPRDSSSNNPLPSYMQPTESARAKALLNSSPRSSPDMQDKEVYIKKRHSLPGATGRQGSPRIQRTMSQGQQALKGSGTHSPQEKKWRR